MWCASLIMISRKVCPVIVTHPKDLGERLRKMSERDVCFLQLKIKTFRFTSMHFFLSFIIDRIFIEFPFSVMSFWHSPERLYRCWYWRRSLSWCRCWCGDMYYAGAFEHSTDNGAAILLCSHLQRTGQHSVRFKSFRVLWARLDVYKSIPGYQSVQSFLYSVVAM